jgi:hypothetical protein
MAGQPRYAGKPRQTGLSRHASLPCYDGMPHAFFTMIGVLDVAREAVRYAAARLRESSAAP